MPRPGFPLPLRHLLGWMLLVAMALALVSCDRFARKPRRYGTSCGQDGECESGVCYAGFCSSSCAGSADCGGGVCIEKHCQAPELDFDGDTLTNAYELKFGMKSDHTDSDGDGIDDPTEIGPDRNNPLDTNGDGIPDAAQSNTADADGDCIIDAADTIKGPDPLPAPTGFCDHGVCKGKADEMVLTCDPASAASKPTGSCLGCVCQPKTTGGVAGWQSKESWCDKLDNDCDGKTDEELKANGQLLGGACTATYGACAKNGKVGVVECATDKTTVCSVEAGGSQAGGTLELCNGLDDDCDGASDEGFVATIGGKTVGLGGACPSCGGKKAVCPDGQTLATPVVTCNTSGSAAECGALPFDPGFTEMRQGAPEPRRSWSLAWWESHSKLRLYGGEVATLGGSQQLAEEWFLEVPTDVVATDWYRDANLAAGPRADAALVSDLKNDLLWLVGGTGPSGQLASDIWLSAGPNSWEALAPSSPDAVPPLPAAEQTPLATYAAKGFLFDAGGKRAIALVDGHLKAPIYAKLGNAGATWNPLDGNQNGATTDVWCAAQSPDGLTAVVGQASGSWWRWSWTGTQLVASELTAAAAPTPRKDSQCVWAPDGKLYIVGGAGATGTPAQVHFATVGGDAAGPTISFEALTTPPALESALGRAGGIAAWSKQFQAIIVAGGYRTVGNLAVHSPEVWAWKPILASVARLDRPAPRARVGHAAGWWPQQQALCFAGGLTAELPTAAGVPNLVPADDAWCLDSDETWHRVANSGILFAFGAGTIDVVNARMVLSGGIKLLNGKTIATLAKLWKGQLLDSKNQVDPSLLPTNVVLTVDLPPALPGLGVVKAQNVANTPQVAAPATAIDTVRNRLILFGGYDLTMETQTYAVLDLKTLKWTDLRAGILAANPQAQIPQPRLGATAFYDGKKDLFAVVGGSIRFVDPGTKLPTLGIDTCGPEGIPGLPSIDSAHPCLALPYTPFNTAPTLAALQFARTPIPAFVDVKNPKADDALFWHWAPGPVFAPALYDAAGMSAWWALPRPTAPIAKSSANAGVCAALDLGPQFSSALSLTHQLQVQFGVCGGLSAVSVVKSPLDPLPPAMFDAKAVYVDNLRQGWLVGGAEENGALSITVWRIGQSCVVP